MSKKGSVYSLERVKNNKFRRTIEIRGMVIHSLSSIGIETIGRFGEWDYLWSDQSLMSGMSIV